MYYLLHVIDALLCKQQLNNITGLGSGNVVALKLFPVLLFLSSESVIAKR